MPTLIYNPSDIDFERRGKHHYHVAFHLDSSWGYSLLPLTIINGLRKAGVGAQQPGIAVFGGTHGNEWEGQVAIKRLSADLNAAEMSGHVLLIPQLSPSACLANQRLSPLDGVNMNRAFPGNRLGTISYRIADFVKTTIFPRVGVVLDLHSGGYEAIFPVCTSFHPIPDPMQRAETAEIASLFDTPFVFIYSSQMASGLLTSEAERDGKIAVGGEFGHAESVSRKGLQHAVEGVMNVLRHYKVLSGDVVKIDLGRSDPPRLMMAENLEDYVPCPRDSIWEPAVDVGAGVKEGELLGWLNDFSDFTSKPVEVHAHRSGILAAMHFAAVCKQGTTLYVIAQEVRFSETQ